jgi:hypothetical protein
LRWRFGSLIVTKAAQALKLRHPIKRTNRTLSSCHD